MNQQVVAARVDNGKVYLLNQQGLACNQFGSTFAAAGVCGEDLVVVSESGIVDHYKIEGSTRPTYKCGLGKTYDAVSIQVGTNLNFSIQRSNGQTDVYANGQKTRTTGAAGIDKPASKPIIGTSINSSAASKGPDTSAPSLASVEQPSTTAGMSFNVPYDWEARELHKALSKPLQRKMVARPQPFLEKMYWRIKWFMMGL